MRCRKKHRNALSIRIKEKAQRTLSRVKGSIQFRIGGKDIPKPITAIAFFSLRQCIACGDRRVRTSRLENSDLSGSGRSSPPFFCNLQALPLKPILRARLQIADNPPGMSITPTISRS
jgi:hypothetical protein